VHVSGRRVAYRFHRQLLTAGLLSKSLTSKRNEEGSGGGNEVNEAQGQPASENPPSLSPVASIFVFCGSIVYSLAAIFGCQFLSHIFLNNNSYDH
jgi:hypothetical protein